MTARSAKAKRKSQTRIGIKRVYEPASSKDGMRVLVDRLWPRGMAKASLKYDAWPKDLAPSNELRKWYGHDPERFGEFRRRYRSELNAHRADLAALRAKIKGRTVTLLTSTRKVDLSHATVLREILARDAGK